VGEIQAKHYLTTCLFSCAHIVVTLICWRVPGDFPLDCYVTGWSHLVEAPVTGLSARPAGGDPAQLYLRLAGAPDLVPVATGADALPVHTIAARCRIKRVTCG